MNSHELEIYDHIQLELYVAFALIFLMMVVMMVMLKERGKRDDNSF